MFNDRPLTLTLELDRDADPIRGTLGDEDGFRRPFVGWLGLASALEEVLTQPTAADPD